jgi:hypothetical protein
MSVLRDLNRDYCSGRFKQIEEDLEKFFRQNKDAIKEFKLHELAKIKGLAASDELAAKLYLLKQRSINPSIELKMELEEIEKEIWYRGEKEHQCVDPNAIACEWSKKHAAGWRDHFIMTTLFIFGRNKEKYLEIINDP